MMNNNNSFMTRINRMPEGTKLERKLNFYGHLEWIGSIYKENREIVGPVQDPNLGTVTENLLILHRRYLQHKKERIR